MNTVFLAGAARADITPQIGTCLYGYRPGLHSESVHDPLNVTALAVGDGKETALLLTVTLCEIRTNICDELRRAASAVSGVPFGNILISATHTHSAPNAAGSEGWGEVDLPYVNDVLFPAVRKAAADAVAAMVPAEYCVGTTESEVAVNRREMRENGSITFGQDPNGSYDPTMTLVTFRNAADKKPILNLVHYNCHGTCAGANTEISRDWSGVMCDILERETGTLSGFWNGAIGDSGPRLTNGKTTGDIRYVEELGAVAGFDAMKAYRRRGEWTIPSLRLVSGKIDLPYKPLPSLDEVNEELKKYPEPEKLINISRMSYKHLADVKELLESGETDIPQALSLDTTLVGIGGLLFIPAPFEMFSTITLRLRRAVKEYPYALTLSNTNAYHSYLPSQDALCRGGYEVDCFLHHGLYLLREDTDTQFITGVLKLLRG